MGLCFTVMLGFVGNGYAAEYAVAAEKFELKVFERTLGGSEIVVGEYAAAIKIISTSLSLDSKYAKNTNLCVAYTAQRKFSSAQPYCQSALTLSASNRYGDLVAFNS